MREEESNWFSRWDEQLPSPDELMPLSQTLITPDLALAFDIRTPNTLISNTTSFNHHHHNVNHGNGGSNQYNNGGSQTPPPLLPPLFNNGSPGGGMGGGGQTNTSSEFDTSGDLGSGGGGVGGDENARTLKRPRLVWTPQLHKRFVDAVAHLGIKNAVPKTIMQLMSVDGLTRENVASHLQKYRLYLRRMQGLSSGGGNGGLVSSDDQLFASTPVPPHFLHPSGRGHSDHFMPFVPVTPLQQQHHHHHHQQHVAHPQLQLQQQFHQHHRQVGHFGSPPNGHYDNPYLPRQSQQQPVHRMGGSVHSSIAHPYIDDLESDRVATEGRKILTLFPTGDD